MKIKDLHPREIIKNLKNRPPVVGAVRLAGVIAASAGPGRQSLNLSQQEKLLEAAFSLKRLKAVAVYLNSPGGSPVQSALLHDRLRALAAEKEVPLFVFCEDVAASGGYWIACAGDEVYANENSIIGSIGVISASFGFEEMIAKIGVERRIHTAGRQKSFLDPFREENEDDVARLKELQGHIHDAFKRHVETRRGSRLAEDREKLFSGEFWSGAEAKKLGLIDEIGDAHQVLREKFGDKVKIHEIEQRKGWLQRRLNFGMDGRVTGELVENLVFTLGARALWQRFGL